MKRSVVSWLLVLVLGQAVFAQEGVTDFNQSFQKALAAKDYDEAIKLLDQDQDIPLAQRVRNRSQIASSLMQANRQEEAIDQVQKGAMIAIEAAKEGNLPNQNMVSAVMLATAMSRNAQGSKVQEFVSDALGILQSRLSDKELTNDHRLALDLLRTQYQMSEPSQQSASMDSMVGHIAKCEELFSKDDTNPTKGAIMLGIWSTQIQSIDPQQGHKVYQLASGAAQKLIKESANASLLSSYTNLVFSYVSKHARNEPDLASDALEQAKSVLDGISTEDKSVTQAIEMFMRNSLSMERTIQGAKRLLAMIGQPAPEIDPMEWVNGEPLSSLGDLKGKVVLIDFWAVWCGPCIATFPHLKHLDQMYGDKGLTILGVTRQYNMKWDQEKNNYVRSETPVELQEELEMLGKFIAKYKLSHRTMVTPEKSDMQSRYAVTGIPHAVVIDKQGLVRLVKIGSGSQNAQEIENMIKQLIAE